MAKEKIEELKSDKIGKIMAGLNTKNKNTIIVASDLKHIRSGYVSFGMPNLDLKFGGGAPRGKITHIYAESSFGKSSTIARMIAYNHQKDPNFYAVVINVEGYWNDESEYLDKMGVDRKRLFVINDEDHEKALDTAVEIARERIIDLIVLDSVAGLIKSDEVDKSLEKREQVGSRASMAEKFCRKITSAQQTKYISESKTIIASPTAVILLNQMRDAFKMTKTGTISYRAPASAKAVKFAVTCECQLVDPEPIHYEFDKDVYNYVGVTDQAQAYVRNEQIGKAVRYHMHKSRNAAQEHRETVCHLYTDQLMYPAPSGFMGFGFDEVHAYYEAAQEIGIVTVSGKWVKLHDLSFDGEKKFLIAMRSQVDIYNILKESVDAYLEEIRNPKSVEPGSEPGAGEEEK